MVKHIRHAAVLLIAIGILTSCTVTNQMENLMTSPSASSSHNGFSLLTDDGVQEIKDSRKARFDFRGLALTNTAAGLPPEHDKDIIIGGPGESDIELTIVGPAGQETISTQTIWIVHNYTDPSFEYLTFWRSFDTAEGADGELAQAPTR